jgi:hypothetical protein
MAQDDEPQYSEEEDPVVEKTDRNGATEGLRIRIRKEWIYRLYQKPITWSIDLYEYAVFYVL